MLLKLDRISFCRFRILFDYKRILVEMRSAAKKNIGFQKMNLVKMKQNQKLWF
ncbi:unnamed protein product [Amoebophrya sp. A25]|nr:unnamed protein product [Amoebophrya sp. A25]|eukprot:GSA25T00013391001.1